MEEVSLLSQIIEYVVLYGTPVAAVIASATAVTLVTPSKVDDKIMGGLGTILNVILKIANTLAGNILKNKNKDA